MRQNGALTYLHGDHLGSAALTTNASGGRVSLERYYPYGGTRDGSMPTDRAPRRRGGIHRPAPRGLPGLLRSFGRLRTGSNARQYDPVLGRFLQADSIVPAPGNPQSLNRYATTLNNPLRYTDLTGHEPIPIIKVVSFCANF